MNMPTSGSRLRLLQVGALCAFLVLALQLLRIQVIDAEHYRRVAAEQQVRALPVEPPRGVITDRNGSVLAHNVPSFAVEIVPGDLPADPADRRLALLQVERETGERLEVLEESVAAGERSVDPFAPVRVQDEIDLERAIVLRAALADLPGVRIGASPVRVYEGGELVPSILGYVGPIEPEQVEELRARGYPLDAAVGQAGVEAVYEDVLRGQPGRLLVAADPRGRELARLGSIDATPGADVVLAIDLELQSAVATALRGGIEKGLPASGRDADGKPALRAGAAVVMDVRSGEVLAMVSFPSYDAAVFAGTPDQAAVERLLSDSARPLLNRAYMEVHAPGSIFKPIVGLAALQEGVATLGTRITSTGAIVVVNQYDASVQYVFRDWAAHGTLDFNGGIARSSDVYFYYLAGGYEQFDGLGSERVARYARAFGLGTETGLDLPGEAAGLVPDAEWKERTLGEEWLLGDTYTYGIGQGYLTATPLQMAVATAALANGGEVLVPRVVRATRSDGVEEPTVRLTRGTLPADARHIQSVRAAMLAAASAGGTATEGKPAGITIGAKTGTAEFGTMRADGSPNGAYDSHGWYIAFAPYEQPEIAVTVYLEHGVGATHAGPVARQIFEAYFSRKTAE
jgi:penicillin-binding protein 2